MNIEELKTKTEADISEYITKKIIELRKRPERVTSIQFCTGFAPIFPDTCYHLTHYWPAAAEYSRGER